jgi:hypothetical protein
MRLQKYLSQKRLPMPRKQKQKQKYKSKSNNKTYYQKVFYSIDSCDSDQIHSIATSVFGSSYYISYEKISKNV